MHARARARVLVVTKLECEIEQPCTHRYGPALGELLGAFLLRQ